MADVNKPDVSSESVQTTPPVALNGTVPPSHLAKPSHASPPTSAFLLETAKEWGLQLLIALGIGLAVLVITIALGYPPITGVMVGAIAAIGSGTIARSLVRRPGTRASVAAAAEEMPQQTDSFREIIETIVFVVVLVLLLKSFAAEAFVIPTGSMAETLFGYQRIIKCPECGESFPVNCSSEVDPTDDVPRPITGCVCPNCRYNIDFSREETVGWKKPDWNSGDRVLVAKFLYELFNKQPNRLDVVVFKYPGDSHGGPRMFPRSGPMKNQTPMNYIKRLIGLPGETIAIHRGKLYILPPGSGVEFDEWKRAQTNEELRLNLWQWEYMHVNDPQAVKLFGEEKFDILRKPPETILAERRLVYDNDHQAKDQKQEGLPPRWHGDGWQEAGTNFKCAGSDHVQWLRYHHYLRDFNSTYDPRSGKPPVRSLISDFMGYNFYTLPEGRANGPAENWVGDLLLEADVAVDKADGEVVLELSKSHDRFRMHWNLATGDIDLYRVDGRKAEAKEEKLATKKATAPKAGSTYRLRFGNIDDRLLVWVDGSLPFDQGVNYKGSKEQFAGPVAENDLEPASFGVKGAGATVSKLKLYRDTYYTAGDNPSDSDCKEPYDPSKPDTWKGLTNNMKLKTLYVQPDHFLCLGDNSPESSDGRSWGTVPERLLLGRAMLVYYPFNRAGRIR